MLKVWSSNSNSKQNSWIWSFYFVDSPFMITFILCQSANWWPKHASLYFDPFTDSSVAGAVPWYCGLLYSCKICPRQFFELSDLRRHLAVDHKTRLIILPSHPFRAFKACFPESSAARNPFYLLLTSSVDNREMHLLEGPDKGNRIWRKIFCARHLCGNHDHNSSSKIRSAETCNNFNKFKTDFVPGAQSSILILIG